MVSLICVDAGSAGHLDLSSTKLSIVEQEGCLGSSLLFENDRGILCVALGSDLDAGNLTAGEFLAAT